LWFKLPNNKNVKKTILNVVGVYLTTTILLVLALSFIYIQNQKDQFKNLQIQQSNTEAKYIIEQLELLHDNIINEIAIYPRNNINSAIYDIDKNLIFSTFKEDVKLSNESYFFKDNYNYYIYKIDPYYLGASFLLIQKPMHYNLNNAIVKIIIIVLFVILILIFTSLILAKMLIKPLSDNLDELDKFIKDTTHELNTPISAILNNIEMLNLNTIDEKNIKKINRIKIGATTISTIYDDLSFLLLHDKQKSNNESLNISTILKDRIEYFQILAHMKNIVFEVDIKDDIYLLIDKVKIQRVFDNLISNSIKYSNINSTIKITLDENSFIIYDEGIGMNEDEIKDIFIRYKRFNTSVGGFGIGYNIIHTILQEYNISIDIESKKDKFTKVTLRW